MLHGNLMRRSDCAAVAAMLALALLASGCSAGGGAGAPAPTASNTSSGSSSFSEKISRFFSGSSAKSPQSATGTQAEVNCPFIDIRQGASTLTVGPTGENAALALKYQGTFVRAARECAVVGGDLVMKVGVQGRLILGPAGGPGQVEVPLRIAVVQETTAGSKPIVTKLIRIPVMVAAGQGFTDFSHIEEGLSFPMPSPAMLEDYTVYIGFDPLAASAQDKQKEKPKPKPKAKQKPA